MKHYRDEWILEWCQANGWTDLFVERTSTYWAFPPNAVMPVPIPPTALRAIKSEKGMSDCEQRWAIAAVFVSIVSLAMSYSWEHPLPATLAFAFAAVTVARLEVD
jgi:hypothetical protein